jgi:GNAT superfamily N-acetyltransferase
MIAAGIQGRGYGGQAIAMALTQARDWGAPWLVVGAADLPHSNKGFYQRYGFRDTGVIEDGDRLLVREVTE